MTLFTPLHPPYGPTSASAVVAGSFLNEVTKLIFPRRSETIAGSSPSRLLRLCFYGLLLLSTLPAITYPPYVALTAITTRADRVRGREVGRRSFWFMDGILIAKISFSLLEISVWKGLLYPFATISDYNRSAQDVSYDIWWLELLYNEYLSMELWYRYFVFIINFFSINTIRATKFSRAPRAHFWCGGKSYL